MGSSSRPHPTTQSVTVAHSKPASNAINGVNQSNANSRDGTSTGDSLLRGQAIVKRGPTVGFVTSTKRRGDSNPRATVRDFVAIKLIREGAALWPISQVSNG